MLDSANQPLALRVEEALEELRRHAATLTYRSTTDRQTADRNVRQYLRAVIDTDLWVPLAKRLGLQTDGVPTLRLLSVISTHVADVAARAQQDLDAASRTRSTDAAAAAPSGTPRERVERFIAYCEAGGRDFVSMPGEAATELAADLRSLLARERPEAPDDRWAHPPATVRHAVELDAQRSRERDRQAIALRHYRALEPLYAGSSLAGYARHVAESRHAAELEAARHEGTLEAVLEVLAERGAEGAGGESGDGGSGT